MLEFERCQSLEKLVIDDEICGITQRLVRGVQSRDEPLAEDLFGDVLKGEHFLTSPLTLRGLREEIRFPSAVIDRRPRERWQNSGGRDVVRQARQRVQELLADHQPKPLPDDVQARLADIMSSDAGRHGMDRLPMP